jgi:hypothetical protein
MWRRGDAAVELSGSVREIVVGSRATDADRFAAAIVETLPSPICVTAARFADCPAFRVVGDEAVWQSLTRVRTNLDARMPRGLSVHLAYDHELLLGSLDTLGADLGEAVASDPFVTLDDEIADFGLGGGDEGRWRHLLYRGFLQYETSRTEVVVGRQRIAWGVGRLWNPIDRFNPIGPLAIESDQSVGIDALNVQWLFSGFTFLQAVYAPQDSSRNASYALRLHGVVRDVDYSVVGGVFEQARTAGLDLAANVGQAAARLEAVYSDPERNIWPVGARARRELGDFWQVVTSIDINVDVGSGLYVLVEHLYNGNGLGFGRGRAGPLLPFFESTAKPPPQVPRAIATAVRGPFWQAASANLFGGSRVVSLSEQLTGLFLSYEPLIALDTELLTIFDWEGTSVAVAPQVRYSPLGSLELTVGGQLFAGPRRSEYGAREHVGFFIAEWFF